MRPVLFTLFGYPFHSYAMLLSAAAIGCTLLAVREGEKRGLWLPPEGGIWVFLGALFGAKIYYIIQFDPKWYLNLWKAVLVWQGGLVSYGGLLGGMAAAYLYTGFHKIPRLQTADTIAPYVALAEAAARLGCFLNGCCFGAPTDLPWGLRFPKGSHAWTRQLDLGLIPETASSSLPVHPTQLYMVLGLVLMALALKVALDRKRFDGQVALLWMLLYGLWRFLVEMFRADSARPLFGMTASQTVSIGLVLFSLVLFVLAWQRGLWKAQGPTRPQASAESGAVQTSDRE